MAIPGYGDKYESPWGTDTPPSWGGDYDWKGASGGIDWGSGFKVAGEDKMDWGSTFSKLFNKANEEKYRKEATLGETKIGAYGAQGQAGKVLDNLSVIYPQQHAPVTIAGTPGKKGFGSTIGGIAGTIGGALIGGPAGAAMGGSIGSGVGGFF